MVLKELADYLQNAPISLGTEGTNLFYGLLPPDPDVCLALFEYPGEKNQLTLGNNTVALELPRVQVVSRGAQYDYDGPRLAIQNVVAAMTKIGDTDLSGVRYLAVEALQAPFLLHIDENFRNVFAVNFRVTKYFSST